MNISTFFCVIKKAFSADGSISKKTAQGTFWLFSFRLADHSFRLVRTIILARLLAPNDFGLFGITVMAVSLLETFSQNGFQQALTQKKGDIIPYLDSAWVVQIVRGLVLALVLFLLAPFIALFFNAPESAPILKVVALAVALQGFYNIAIVYFSKNLQFHKYFLYQIMGTLADFTVSVVLAFMLRSVWALVFGLLAGCAARLVISYAVYPYYPRLKFNAPKAGELFKFGKWIFFSNVIVFFIMQADSFFVAKMLGIAALGFYQIAYKIPSVLAIEIIAGAIFPAYAKIQDDIPRIREAYVKTLKIFSSILIPMAGGIFAITPEFVRLFLGIKWLPAVGAMQVLVLSTLIWTIAFLSNYVFLALGKPHIETWGITIRFLILAILLYPFIVWWGILGASIAVLLSVICSASWLTYMVLKIMQCPITDFLKKISVPLAGTVCMVLVILMIKNLFAVTMVNFFGLVMAGMVVYFLLMYMADRLFKNQMGALLKESLQVLIK